MLFIARMGRLAGLREGKASASVVVVALPCHVVRRVLVSPVSSLCLDSFFT